MEVVNFNLRKKRTVSEMVSEVFNYLKIHIWNLFKVLLVIVGPFYIVGSIFIGRFYGGLFTMAATAVQPSASDFLMLIPSIILLFIGFLFYQLVIVSYLNLSLDYSKKDITIAMVFTRVKKRFWAMFGANLFFTFGMVIAFAVVGILLALISPILMVFVIYFAMIYVLIAFSLYPFPIEVENASIIESFKRSFELIKGNWWRSFGYYLLLYFIQSFIMGIFMMPIYFLVFFQAISQSMGNPGGAPDMSFLSTIMTIMMPVLMFISLFISSFYTIGFGIHYFSLVEQKDEVGLAQQIEALNTNSESTSLE